ncbi:hypothetical protein SAMN04488137_4705 [Fictibacillus solisalsi]|uniref:Uncharacterized protein n=1 Tax=Fictibacillus solisalsi TaxID=459525 RepID=A0A1H0BZ66_9BACL|nr:hypothetical protein [Fictibacillus solisalsi]SDN50924.1 hypothetical protein SAMN04488137_4705 [Fictibacillus solisalsi]
MTAIDREFKRLGFNVGISLKVFVRSISKDCILVVEGSRLKGFSEYRYTFYKTKHLPDGRMTCLKVYMENESIRRVLPYVASFLSFLERIKQIKKKECEEVASKGK